MQQALTRKPSYFLKSYAYAPLYVFLSIYIFTCVLGAVFTLTGYKPFIYEYQLGTGTLVPTLTNQQVWINVLLLFLAPCLVCIGYWLANKETKIAGFLQKMVASLHIEESSMQFAPVFFNAIFYVLASIALYDLIKAGSISLLDSWFSYGTWILARWMIFENIGFFGFVNIYTLVPIASVLVLLAWHPKSWVGIFFRWLPLFIAIFIEMLLFQRKSVMLLEFIAISGLVSLLIKQNNKKDVIKLIVITPFILLVTYYILMLLPLISPKASGVAGQHNQELIAKLVQGSKKFPTLTADIDNFFHPRKLPVNSEKEVHYNKDQWMEHLLDLGRLSLMAPLGRTSVPSLYYPTIFPAKHPYYGLYVGQSIFGFGHMPDDNVVVWHYMDPGIPGAVTAPFQFVLYSQIGLTGALVGSLVVGLILGFCWRISYIIHQPFACLLSSMVLLLSLYISIDSLHNSVLVSYGVSWGVFFILGIWLFFLLMSRVLAKNPMLKAG